mgnify:FL=1|jgi:signal recognition particle protein
MAFDGLSERLQGVFDKLRKKGKLQEEDLNIALREVRLALLEADVNYKVVKEFVANVKDKALGSEVLESLTPGQQVISVVNEELTTLMGGEAAKLEISSKPPTVIMMVGLQGSGKTTTTGKLGLYLSKKQNKKPLFVACDVYRPAAITQLEVLGEQTGLPVYSEKEEKDPVKIAQNALTYAKTHGNDIVLIDTAGRLHIDEALMQELNLIKEVTTPTEILLVIDSMTGQDAVNVAENFNQVLDLSGVILTKLDGDTRGGAALSVRKITNKPIKFVGMGEKLDQLEVFHPDRMASRILGMGDILTLIDKAKETYNEKEAKALQDKILKSQFTFDDYLAQIEQMSNMGDLNSLVAMIPGISKKSLKGIKLDNRELDYSKAIIRSMTKEERNNPKIINGSRRKRIAQGSGRKVQEVNRLLKQFEQSQVMMKQLTQLTGGKGSKKRKLPFFGM